MSLLIAMPLVSFIINRAVARAYGPYPSRAAILTLGRASLILLWMGCGLALLGWSFLGQGAILFSQSLFAPIFGWGLMAALVLVQLFVIVRARAKPQTLQSIQSGLEGTYAQGLMPKSAGDLWRWALLSVSTGLTEEVIWRGVALATLSSAMPLWMAVILSLTSFTLGHVYQSGAGIVRIMILGLVFTLLTLTTNSLVPAIILHSVINFTTGWLAYLTVRAHPDGIKST